MGTVVTHRSSGSGWPSPPTELPGAQAPYARRTSGRPKRVAVRMMMDVLNSTTKPRLFVCGAGGVQVQR